MADQNNQKSTNFWFGFSLGILSTAALIYLFGTEKGRKTVKKVLDLTENFEENLMLINDALNQMGNEDNKQATKKITSSIDSILNKVSSLTR